MTQGGRIQANMGYCIGQVNQYLQVNDIRILVEREEGEQSRTKET